MPSPAHTTSQNNNNHKITQLKIHRKHQTIIEKFKGGRRIWQKQHPTILYEHPFSLSFMIQNNYRYTQWCTYPCTTHTNTPSSLVSIESVFFFRSNLFCTQTSRTETKFAHPLSLSAMLICLLYDLPISMTMLLLLDGRSLCYVMDTTHDTDDWLIVEWWMYDMWE